MDFLFVLILWVCQPKYDDCSWVCSDEGTYSNCYAVMCEPGAYESCGWETRLLKDEEESRKYFDDIAKSRKPAYLISIDGNKKILTPKTEIIIE